MGHDKKAISRAPRFIVLKELGEVLPFDGSYCIEVDPKILKRAFERYVAPTVSPIQLSGRVAVPPSKSQTLRAILFGLMGSGKTMIHNPLLSSDTEAALRAICHLGAKLQRYDGRIEIEGVAGKLKAAEDVLDVQNSGILLRFLSALTALSPTYTVITGDDSIRHRRPMSHLLKGLKQLGAFA